MLAVVLVVVLIIVLMAVLVVVPVTVLIVVRLAVLVSALVAVLVVVLFVVLAVARVLVGMALAPGIKRLASCLCVCLPCGGCSAKRSESAAGSGVQAAVSKACFYLSAGRLAPAALLRLRRWGGAEGWSKRRRP